jgi:hypothetical protein
LLPQPTVHVVNDKQKLNFWEKVNKTHSCWLWMGSKDRNGYGQVRIGKRPGKLFYTHRLAYEMLVGLIPSGMVIDHLCKNPACCNPDHLEPVTQRENVRRGRGNGYRERTHCIRGHEFTPENTRRQTNGGRQCISCKVEYDRLRWIERTA